MILDCHIHISDRHIDHEVFVENLKKAGIDGGVVLSLSPQRSRKGEEPCSNQDRLNEMMALTQSYPNLYPFYWLDPTEADAIEQVDEAVKAGVAGFKVICNHFYPGDPVALRVFRRIAKAGLPILFHSGILWDEGFSSKYNRPGEFEALLEVEGLRFALAHISWPWCDECLAVYGKLQNSRRRREYGIEMFIDITPGTPPIYREEALYKLLHVGYDLENNILFGTDNLVNRYDPSYTRKIMDLDNGIYDKFSIGPELRNKIYSENLLRFLNK